MRGVTIKYIFLVLLSSVYSLGCGWVNGTTIDGQWVERSGRFLYLHDESLRSSLDSTPRQKLHYFQESLSDKEQENNITKAVLLMLDGNYEVSIQQLLIEEKVHNKSYEVATNLGTAYELSGDNVNALKWIQEGINRNPDSHYGTEWLHVKILETKLKLQDNPVYLKSHHVIDFNEYAYEDPRYIKDILYQLRERMLFVKPKDTVVADLLYSYALANANDGGFLEYSIDLLELSEEYGYLNSQELAAKKKEYQKMIDHVAFIKNLKIALYVVIFPLLFLFIAYKKKWFFLTRKAQQAYIEEKNNHEKLKDI